LKKTKIKFNTDFKECYNFVNVPFKHSTKSKYRENKAIAFDLMMSRYFQYIRMKDLSGDLPIFNK
jgi:hypothetical protein